MKYIQETKQSNNKPQRVYTTMNVDKFGHHVHKRLRISEYIEPPNEALVKSNEGWFDLKFARLISLPSPEHDDDAVKKSYVDEKIQDLNLELNKIYANVKVYLHQLEKITLQRTSSSYYTKQEVDKLIQSLQDNIKNHE